MELKDFREIVKTEWVIISIVLGLLLLNVGRDGLAWLFWLVVFRRKAWGVISYVIENEKNDKTQKKIRDWRSQRYKGRLEVRKIMAEHDTGFNWNLFWKHLFAFLVIAVVVIVSGILMGIEILPPKNVDQIGEYICIQMGNCPWV